MYEKHFNLATAPFNLNPDPRFLYVTEQVREALATLAYGVNNRKGFVLLTGDVGTGKTTLLNVFMQWLTKRSAATAFVFNPHMRPDEFLDFVMADFGIECESTMKSRRLYLLNDWLLKRHAARQPVVLIIDEAQRLTEEMLEELRLLTNLETPTYKLLQIVLSGQIELDKVLARPSMRQLRQRITLRCRTIPLTARQTGEYIAQRIHIAGGNYREMFEPAAAELVFTYSRGIVRIINLLCEQALIGAFCDNEKRVTPKQIHFAARELDFIEPKAAVENGPTPDTFEPIQEGTR
jgi:type II secretory pathway predicted ATPase ExeA